MCYCSPCIFLECEADETAQPDTCPSHTHARARPQVRPGYEKRKSMEKWAIRQAFDTPDKPYLPEEVLWRQKEQFSDGVGYNWIDSLKVSSGSLM